MVIPSKGTSSYPTKLKLNNDTVVNQLQISEIFNNYFVEIGQSIADKNGTSNETDFKKYLKNSVLDTLMLDPPLAIEILDAINSMNLYKACGYNNISSYFLAWEKKF